MPATLSPRLRVDFPAVQTRLNAEEEAVVMETIRNSPTWSQGEQQQAFEREFTRYVDCADSLAVSSCTSALEMAAALCGLTPGGRGHSPGPHLCVQCRSLCPHRSPAGVRRYRSGHPAAVGRVRQALPHGADQGDRGGPPLRFARRHGPDSPPGPGAWTQGGGRRGPGPGRGLQGAQDRIHGGLCRFQLPQPEEYLHSGRGRHADHQGCGGRGAGPESSAGWATGPLPESGSVTGCRPWGTW